MYVKLTFSIDNPTLYMATDLIKRSRLSHRPNRVLGSRRSTEKKGFAAVSSIISQAFFVVLKESNELVSIASNNMFD